MRLATHRHISALGQVSFGLRELARDPAPPLDAVQGTAMIASCFLLSENAPSASCCHHHSSSLRWCAAFERRRRFGRRWRECNKHHGFRPQGPPTRVTAARASPVGPQAGRRRHRSARRRIAIGMLLESCGTTSNVDEFEACRSNLLQGRTQGAARGGGPAVCASPSGRSECRCLSSSAQ